jgi:hypothetical protein
VDLGKGNILVRIPIAIGTEKVGKNLKNTMVKIWKQRWRSRDVVDSPAFIIYIPVVDAQLQHFDLQWFI